MAIAFRAAGATLKADVSASGGAQSVALPAGHVSGDALLLFVLTDDKANVAADPPPGWTRVFHITAGTATAEPNYAPPRLKVFVQTDPGSLGSSVPLTFSTAAWPAGNPYVLAFTAAYTGVDPSAPVERFAWNTATATTVTQPHGQLTTTRDGDWLLTFRAVSSDSPAATFTESVGTDVERVDDSSFAELACALYDSNAALVTGLQTQRSTTASRAATYGSLQVSLALQPPSPPAAATAPADVGQVAATAFNASVDAKNGGWDLCGPGGLPTYRIAIDWAGTGTGQDVTGDIVSDISVTYGRDQNRQLNPAAVGSAAFTLNNTGRRYSPENSGSPLFGDLEPARTLTAAVDFNGQTYPLFRGKIDDFTVKADFGDRTVDFTFLDALNDLSAIKLSTRVYASRRTGDLVNTVLDAAGWTGPRDIDPGVTAVKFWWAEGTDALSAINDLVKSEGPPSIAYVAPSGTFVFRDRHHRMLRPASQTARATFSAGRLGNCDVTAPPPGTYSLAKPFTYTHGWRDIVNSVAFTVEERSPSPDLSVVWSDDSTYALALGQSMDFTVSGSDPFINAVTPAGSDLVYTGPGVVGVLLSRTSGASAKLTVTAVGGQVTITHLQLRAQPLPVQQTVAVARTDPGSIGDHGERTFPDTAPWAGAEDAEAIADMVLLHYAHRRPTVDIRLVSSDPAHLVQVLQRTVSDRIRIVNGEMGLADDFFVERVTHTVQRIGRQGRPPVHAVVLGCEKNLVASVNPFRFDVRGAGFDAGVFDPTQADDPVQVFIFDDLTQGLFDHGRFGT